MDFPSTCWTVLAQATLRGGDAEKAALEQLCRDYYRPVWACIRSRIGQPDRADDLTQDFFLHLMERSFFTKADPDRGRFRSFLLGALRFFLAEDIRQAMTQKAGGNLQRSELTDDAVVSEVEDSQFDREWAQALLGKALGHVEADVRSARGDDAWSILRLFLPGSTQAPSYNRLAEHLGMTEGGAKTEVFRLRQKYRDAIRREVGRTVAVPHEIDDELAHLREILRAELGLASR